MNKDQVTTMKAMSEIVDEMHDETTRLLEAAADVFGLSFSISKPSVIVWEKKHESV